MDGTTFGEDQALQLRIRVGIACVSGANAVAIVRLTMEADNFRQVCLTAPLCSQCADCICGVWAQIPVAVMIPLALGAAH